MAVDLLWKRSREREDGLGIAHDIITTYMFVIVKALELRAPLDDRTISELHIFSGDTFRALSVATLPRAKALGCSVGPFHGQSAAGTSGSPRACFRLVLLVMNDASRFFDYRVSTILSATRSACAAIVNAGLQAADEGKNELSTT
jgi:hypothetical protein